MHCLQNERPAPTAPFAVGPYLVIPTPLRGSINTRYTITRAGKACGQQISYPDLAQCQDRERETLYLASAQHAVRRHRARFNNVAPIRCKTCKTEKPRSMFYRVDGHNNRLMKSCKPCVDAGLDTDLRF